MKNFAKIALVALAILVSPCLFSQTLDFTLNANSTDGKTVVPKLTWATTPAAVSCNATGASAWAGTKAVSGTQTLPAVSTSQTYVLACSWPGAATTTVTWTAPTTNTDNTPYTDPGGFHVYYGNTGAAEEQLTQMADIHTPTATSWTSPALATGSWYFGVKAYNVAGLESPLSNVATKSITGGVNQTRTLSLAIKIPKAPVVQ